MLWTFEDWLRNEHQVSRGHGYRLLESVSLMRKLEAANVSKNVEIGDIEKPVLPTNEAQLRPLINCLGHDGERIHVWQQVAQSGEKITAALVQRKVLLGRRYNRVKKAHGGDRKSESSGQNDHLNTAESIAQQHGVSEKTVRRAGQYAAATGASTGKGCQNRSDP